MLSTSNSKAPQNYHYDINTAISMSPKGSTNNAFFSKTIDSPKSINFNNMNTLSSNKLITNNSLKNLNLRKFTTLNTNPNVTKTQSMNSTSSSKFPLSTYISCSTLQSGVASYSIPKSKRFKGMYKTAYCDSIYNLPDYKSTGVSIGNSKRKDLFDKNKENIPSTHDYFFTSIFEDNLNKKRGNTISNKFNITDEKKNFPGPADYEKTLLWQKQSPCTLKFRKSYFYQDESKQLHEVSPMKYLPSTKVVQATRYNTYGIGIGLGKRSQDQYNNMKVTPGPGNYNLPSLFEKRLQGKYPIN